MKAAFVKRPNKISLEETPRPELPPGGAILRIQGCAVCGSDYLEAAEWAAEKKRFGHEIAATVEEISAPDSGLRVGDQVGLAFSLPCGECPACRQGNPRRCTGLILAEQEGFAEYVAVKDPRLLCKTDPGLPLGVAVLVEPLTVLLDAFHLAAIRPGERLLIIGGGNLGRLALLLAKAWGLERPLLIGRDLTPGLEACLAAAAGSHYAWLKKMGSPETFPPELNQELAQTTQRLVVINTSPPWLLNGVIDLLPYDTRLVNLGIARAKKNRLKLDAFKLILKRLQLLSAFPVPCLHLKEAVKTLCAHTELFAAYPTETRPLSDLKAILTSGKRPDHKVIILPHG